MALVVPGRLVAGVARDEVFPEAAADEELDVCDDNPNALWPAFCFMREYVSADRAWGQKSNMEKHTAYRKR